MPEQISHYRIESELGRGGMGIVYRAVDTRLGRPVAIKMLPGDATLDPDRRRRFVQEAQAASALNHPNIVTIHDIDEDAGTTCIVMELVDGTPLDRKIADGPLPVAKALEYASQVASALESAHANGIVHRDIKPANILITRDDRAKVLDFGLAKLVERDPAQATITSVQTRAGVIMGTAAYMSPEQAQGGVVTPQSDLFSLGAVLYEMLTGRRAFAGTSDLGLITAILRDTPPPLRAALPGVKDGLQAIVDRCLAKDPAARYRSAQALRVDLDAERLNLTKPAESAWRRPAVLVPLIVVLAALGGVGTWVAAETRRTRWAYDEAIPEILRLEVGDNRLDAVRLARRAEPYAKDEIARVRQTWYPLNLQTDPSGARVEIQSYMDRSGSWEPLGDTPLTRQLLPLGPYRLRVVKAGYAPVEITIATSSAQVRTIRLVSEASTPEGMVLVTVPDHSYSFGVARQVPLPDYWIDKYELTNRQYKQFVDAGGYRDPKYWTEPFRDGSSTLSFDAAVSRFRDATGRTGPATWELGSFKDGQADFPVGGISWFEASAYARFAGKRLPTVYHWYRASNPDELFADILRRSNFDGTGPVRVGERGGLGPWGTLDMAGNVKEWCANAVENQGMRYILGGAWNEPNYRYIEPDARNPWDRGATFGVRLMRNAASSDTFDAARAPIANIYGDPNSVVPVSDALFESYRRFYSYDRSPLNAKVDAVDDTAPYWRKESISFDAAYSGERVPAYLFLPKNASPPYQTVVFFPSGYAVNAGSSTYLDYSRFDFIVRSGRALIYPVYQGTYDRRTPASGMPATYIAADRSSALRDLQIQQAKDFFRAIDYLETRPEIDAGKLAYYSLSMGAFFGPIPVALEPRIKTAVLASAGLRFNYPPEIQPANFAPRVKVPVLLLNGRNDFQNPPEDQRRLLELLGSRPEEKELVTLDGGHVPNDTLGMIKHVLDWLDKYLGPVR